MYRDIPRFLTRNANCRQGKRAFQIQLVLHVTPQHKYLSKTIAQNGLILQHARTIDSVFGFYTDLYPHACALQTNVKSSHEEEVYVCPITEEGQMRGMIRVPLEQHETKSEVCGVALAVTHCKLRIASSTYDKSTNLNIFFIKLFE